jgi:phosphoglycolate phosphatase
MSKLLINGNLYQPKFILFDVDGTLVDDLHRYSYLGKARYLAFRKLASRNAAEKWVELTGVNPENWNVDPTGPISKAIRRDDLAIAAVSLYKDGYNWYDAKKLAEKIYNTADEIQKKTFKPRLYEGTELKIRELYDKGFKLGIATNGVTGITEELFIELGIKDLFSVIVGADLVEKGKPAPDLIIHACNLGDYQTIDCMYVGDQKTDIEAAKKAGVLISLGVRNSDLKPLADETLDDLRDIQIYE